jgi:hypothetical protein
MKKILMMGLLGACCIGFAQDAAPGGGAGRPGGRRGGAAGGPGGPRQGATGPAFIERLQTSAKELLALYDKNGDGKLDEAERAAMEKEFADIEEKARLARFYQQIKAIDSDGDMVISAEEAEAAPAKLRELQRTRMEEMRRNRPERPERPTRTARPARPADGERGQRRRPGAPAADAPPAPPAAPAENAQ